MIYTIKSFMINNMCVVWIEGINHDHSWQNNKPKLGINYFITRNIFERKKLLEKLDEIIKKKIE